MTEEEFVKELENIMMLSAKIDFYVAVKGLYNMLTSYLVVHGISDVEAIKLFIHSLGLCRKSINEINVVKDFMGIKDE